MYICLVYWKMFIINFFPLVIELTFQFVITITVVSRKLAIIIMTY